jgi:hypothetical protein
VSFPLLGALGLLAAFGIGSLGAALLVLAAWRLLGARISRMGASSRARVLLAMRLFPTAAGLLVSLGLLLPAYLVLEPRRAGEIPGVTFWLCALAGIFVAGRGVWRLVSTFLATERVVRTWSRGATPVALDGVGGACAIYRIETRTPIVALAGTRRPRLFIASSVLDGCEPDLVAAMVAHEVGHRRSGDNVKRLMLEGAADPLPLFPSGRRMREEWESATEESADDDAIASGARPEDLAESLVRVARLASRAPIPEAAVAAAFYRGEAFERRVRRLLSAPARLARTATGLGRAGGLLLSFAGSAWLALTPGALEPLHQLFELIVHAP